MLRNIGVRIPVIVHQNEFGGVAPFVLNQILSPVPHLEEGSQNWCEARHIENHCVCVVTLHRIEKVGGVLDVSEEVQGLLHIALKNELSDRLAVLIVDFMTAGAAQTYGDDFSIH